MSNNERDKRKVGDIRPSQLLLTYGIGSIVDLPRLSVMVMGLEDWPQGFSNMREVVEERLLNAVRGVAGYQLEKLMTPPTVADDDATLVGVPVATFPRWMVCPSCQLLASVDSGLFELSKPDYYHPDRNHYVHINCNKAGKPPTIVPARFLVTCENGHLDDFPWMDFIHGFSGECRGTLRLFELTPSGEARDLYVKCETCGKSRNLAEAFGQANRDKMPFCRGRRPHLRDYDPDGCDKKIRPIVLGASNMWFPILFTSIALPTASIKLDQLIEEKWATFGKATAKNIIAFMREMGQLGELTSYDDDEIWEAIQKKKSLSEEEVEETYDLKEPEWRLFTQHNSSLNSNDFRLHPVPVPDDYGEFISQVVLVERMREVRALAGFTRLDFPDEFSDLTTEEGRKKVVPLGRKLPTWIPAAEVRGEGIFIQFSEERIKDWMRKKNVTKRNEDFFHAHVHWREARYISDPSANYPGIRYVMLHTFAHTLIRQLAMESGYNAASLRERIYSRGTEGEEEPMAGILIYTSTSDSEGTLGGLVNLGEPETLGKAYTICTGNCNIMCLRPDMC